MKVLNVGGGNKKIPIPGHFEGWDHILLDIDPKSGADVICDAREIKTNLARQYYDAIYCSHNLEHYYRHDLPKVLDGFLHCVKEHGFVEIHVPNMKSLFAEMAKDGADIEDVLYVSPAGPIKAIDMIYGLGSFIEHSGNDFMCHKNAFTPNSLATVLFEHGFPHVFIASNGLDLAAFAFKHPPIETQIRSLKLKYPTGEIA